MDWIEKKPTVVLVSEILSPFYNRKSCYNVIAQLSGRHLHLQLQLSGRHFAS